VISAIVAHALVGLGRTALTSRFDTFVAVAGYLAGVHEVVTLVGAGTPTALWVNRYRPAVHQALLRGLITASFGLMAGVLVHCASRTDRANAAWLIGAGASAVMIRAASGGEVGAERP
jgi:hypothetical protein